MAKVFRIVLVSLVSLSSSRLRDDRSRRRSRSRSRDRDRPTAPKLPGIFSGGGKNSILAEVTRLAQERGLTARKSAREEGEIDADDRPGPSLREEQNGQGPAPSAPAAPERRRARWEGDIEDDFARRGGPPKRDETGGGVKSAAQIAFDELAMFQAQMRAQQQAGEEEEEGEGEGGGRPRSAFGDAGGGGGSEDPGAPGPAPETDADAESDEEGGRRSGGAPSPAPEDLEPPRPSLALECRTFDSYDLMNKVDEGTYGAVYRARDKYVYWGGSLPRHVFTT